MEDPRKDIKQDNFPVEINPLSDGYFQYSLAPAERVEIEIFSSDHKALGKCLVKPHELSVLTDQVDNNLAELFEHLKKMEIILISEQ